MKTIAPQVNNNGTDVDELVGMAVNIRMDLLDVAMAMKRALPHGRDYQTGGDYEADRAEAERRIAVVQDIAEAYYQDAILIKEQS